LGYFAGTFANLYLPRCGTFGILLHRGIADFLSALPLPFLGVSSLNLAALTGAAIFFMGGLRPARPFPRLAEIVSFRLADPRPLGGRLRAHLEGEGAFTPRRSE